VKSTKILRLNSNDNVAIALEDLEPGKVIFFQHEVGSLEIEIRDTIPFAHKVAIKNINMGCNVIKYGEIIGCATENIKIGQWVHTHNIHNQRAQ